VPSPEKFQLKIAGLNNRREIFAGVDEVGRGPLAGDVVAAAVILAPDSDIKGLNDSKKLSARKREFLAAQIKQHCVAYAIAKASVEEIDRLNILRASLLAMHRAVKALREQPEFVFVDGKFCPDWDYASMAIIKGDAKVEAIAAASIIAKVSRDNEMQAMDQKYPGYGFAKHKGYPTSAHFMALKEMGPCSIHRKSFKPVADSINLHPGSKTTHNGEYNSVPDSAVSGTGVFGTNQ